MFRRQGRVAWNISPLNDMDHPIVSVGEEVRQVDEDWYCVHMV